ncbi:MAG TPA: biotin/lipoate--protein ligase family protein [Candidatus Cybelea sp.]|nr:biotin/lipoate--protein ligase family protein [Candidatus Cybelea sp.]
MPPDRRSRKPKSDVRAVELPPPFRLVVLREVNDAFRHACANALELGAGTLVFVGRFDLAEFAIVLEPEEPLAEAHRAFYAAMGALADALAALAPPEKPIEIGWPDAVYVDGGLIGGGRLGWPKHAGERAAPDWLVFGAAIRTVSLGENAAGLHPLATALQDEGFGDFSAERLVEGFARHFMVALDRWKEDGFAPIAHDYVSRLKRENGARCDIDGNGDLLIRRAGRPVERRHLQPALHVPSWLDRESGGPRL